MARIRNIKPAFFRHEALQDLEAAHPGQHIMLVYIALWTQCDAAGVFPWKPRQLKLDILPFIDFSLDQTLHILNSNNFIQHYQADGAEWGYIPTFDKHQRITGKEATEGEKYPKPGENKPGNNRETTGKQPDAQERSTGKDNREREGANAHAREGQDFPEKNDPVFANVPLGEFADTYQAISAWGDSDDGHAEILNWKKITGYRDSQHGPTTDELVKFVSYHLGEKNTPQNRAAFRNDPIPYFRARFPGWLTNAKTMNRPHNKGKPPSNAYTPPPIRRQPGSNTGPATISEILKQPSK